MKFTNKKYILLLLILLSTISFNSSAQKTISLTKGKRMLSGYKLVNPQDSVFIKIDLLGAYRFSKAIPDNEYYININNELSIHTVFKNGVKNGTTTYYYPARSSRNSSILQDLKKVLNPNAKIHKTINYKDGIVNGAYKIYHENGRLAEESYLKNGKKIGEWKSYYNDGILGYQQKFIDGKPFGKSRTFYENGDLKSLVIYRAGIPVETWKYYNKFDKLHTTVRFKENEILIKRYSYGFLTKDILIKNVAKNEQWKTYLEKDISIKHYHSGIEDFLQKTYNKNASILHVMPRSIINNNDPKVYLDNNTRFYLREKIDTKFDGKITYYYKNSSINKIANYEKGELDGENKGYYKNGSVMFIGHYKNGYKSGKWISYHKSGKISKTGTYIKGKRTGKWEIYHRDGKVIEIYIYENGKKRETKWAYYFNNKIS